VKSTVSHLSTLRFTPRWYDN